MRNNLIDKELLEKLQKHFCRANDVYLACVDRERNILTAHYGSEEEQAFLNQYRPDDIEERLYEAIAMSQVETIVEVDLDVPFLKQCAIINRISGSVAIIWIVAAVLEEKIPEGLQIPDCVCRTTENYFYRSMAFLEALSRQLFTIKEHQLSAQEAMEQALAAEEKYKKQLCRSEAMGAVVHMMESEAPFSQIVDNAIQEVCQVLDIQGGCLLQVAENGKEIVSVCEYSAEKNWNLAEKLQGKKLSQLPFFDGKPYMLSSDSMMREDLENFFIRYHLMAGVFHPIEIDGKNTMYLCFYEFEQERTWSMEDIKFINDVKRVIQEIQKRRLAKESLAGSYASLEAILENVGCAIYVVDYEKKEVLYVNQTLRQMASKDMDQNSLHHYFFEMENLDHGFTSKEIHLKKHNIYLDINQVEITWIDGRIVSLGTIYDITEKKLYQQKIEKQVSNDNLTGLYNRMRCEQDLEYYMKLAEKNGSEGAYLCIDLDDFKNINDALGHQYGDILLKAIAHNLPRIEGIETNCYRIGGDEFAVIVHGDMYKELSRICRDLRAIFERPWFLKNEDYYCTMSMGVVCFPTDGNSVDDLTRKVGMALQAAKKKGKNAVEFYNEKVEDTSIYRLDLEQNMRRATLNSCNEFEVYYQPIISYGKQEDSCCGAEALVRWNSTDLGFILPNDFIPLAEYLGLINPIGEHVLYEAVKRCKYWNDCGHPDYKISVNISAIQLLQPDFVGKVKQILTRVKINPKNVTLEVTESLAINDMDRMKKVLNHLKSLGVCIALDDFGTGYSSLNHIREIPFDTIKIDKCFVDNLSEDPFAGAFIKMVSELAKTVGMSVCVEGVEQRKQLEILKDMNIDMIQGYYYGNPMSVKEFEKKYL